MPRRSGDAAALDPDYSEVDATSPLLPHPANHSAAPSARRGGGGHRQPRPTSIDDEADVEQQKLLLSGDDSLDDGERAYARLRWAVASLIIASFIAVVLWLALGGGSSAQERCRNRDPGFPGQDQVGYAGPTPTVRLFSQEGASHEEEELTLFWANQGTEAMAAATSYPSYHDTSPIAPPADLDSKQVGALLWGYFIAGPLCLTDLATTSSTSCITSATSRRGELSTLASRVPRKSPKGAPSNRSSCCTGTGSLWSRSRVSRLMRCMLVTVMALAIRRPAQA